MRLIEKLLEYFLNFGFSPILLNFEFYYFYLSDLA